VGSISKIVLKPSQIIIQFRCESFFLVLLFSFLYSITEYDAMLIVPVIPGSLEIPEAVPDPVVYVVNVNVSVRHLWPT
jgi:hypothetical protein